MYSKFLKSILVFNRAQNKAPNFIVVYLLVSLVWHNQFFTTFLISDGSFSSRLSSALSENTHQYIAVLFSTFLFFILRLSYLYFMNKTNDFVEKDEPIESKIGNDQIFDNNKDVARIIVLLEETKAKLSKVKEREAQTQIEKDISIRQVLSIQAELDLALVDITILTKTNNELKSKLNEYEAA